MITLNFIKKTLKICIKVFTKAKEEKPEKYITEGELKEQIKGFNSKDIKDIKNYCSTQNIVYLTTIDFLYYAYIRKKMTADECKEFIETVNSKDSKLPNIDITRYFPKFQL